MIVMGRIQNSSGSGLTLTFDFGFGFERVFNLPNHFEFGSNGFVKNHRVWVGFLGSNGY